MHFSSPLISLMALSFTAALPTGTSNLEELNSTEISGDLEARNYEHHIWIDVYEHAYFQSPAKTAGAPKNDCSKMFQQAGWNYWTDFSDRISSINVRDGTRCQFWEHNDCKGRYWYGSRVENLADGDGYMNDKISSFKCYGN